MAYAFHFGFTHFYLTHLCASHPVAAVDKRDRVVCVLVGRPVGAADWEDCWKRAEQDMSEATKNISGATKTRRGDFPCFATGVSHRGGQKVCLIVRRGPQVWLMA